MTFSEKNIGEQGVDDQPADAPKLKVWLSVRLAGWKAVEISAKRREGW
jgi:hypothetical protein